MSRLAGLLAIVVFALATTASPVLAQGKKEPVPKPDKAGPPVTEPLDINSAAAVELKGLPGVSAAQANKIVENGPYKRTDELVQKKILPRATYEKIKHLIVAKKRR